MDIVKKNGRKEDFDIKKVETSLINSAQDIDYTLTDSDLRLITGDIYKIIESLAFSGRTLSTYEVRGVIYSVLYTNKFLELCRSYMNL